MPPSVHPQRTVLPPVAVEFLLLLNRTEDRVRSGAGWVDADVLAEDHDLWFTKLRAFEIALSDRLSLWSGLDEASVESYKSRIEDLRPRLQQSLEQQRVAAQKAIEEEEEVFEDNPAPSAQNDLTDSPPSVSTDRKVDILDVVAPFSPTVDVRNLPSRPEVSDVPSARARLLHENRSQPKPMSSEERDIIESDMLGITQSMIGAAQSFKNIVKADNDVLDQVSSEQTKGMDRVTKEQNKANQMLRSGNLSFCFTMVILAVSVVIWFMMIPFIIIT